MLVLDAHPHARAVLGAALKDAPAHAYLLHGPRAPARSRPPRAFAGELLAKKREGPRQRPHQGQARRPSRPHVGDPVGRARDAQTRRRRVRRRRGRAHAVRGPAPDLRARARGHDERRGRQRAAEDARGAARLRRPDPAHGQRHAGPADDRQPLPGRPVRPARSRPARAQAAVPRRPAGDRRSRGAALARRRPQGARARPRRRPGRSDKPPNTWREPHCTAPPAPHAPGRPSSTAPGSEASRPRPRSRTRSRKSCSTSPRRSTSAARRSSTSVPAERIAAPPRRRSTTRSSSTGLWYRDLVLRRRRRARARVPLRPHRSPPRGRRPNREALRRAQELVDDTRARLILNVSEELACEALAYRLEEVLSSSSSSA